MDLGNIDGIQPRYGTVRPSGDTAGKGNKRQSSGEFQQALKKQAGLQNTGSKEQPGKTPTAAADAEPQTQSPESQQGEDEQHLLDALA